MRKSQLNRKTPLRAKTGFKARGKPMKKVGKTGEANLEARKRIAEIAEEKELNYCELGFTGCLKNMYLAPAHRHKRNWYKGDIELLSNFNQWISACQNCHNVIENNKDLTEGVFEKLRG